MNIKKIAVAALVPAAVAGVTVSSWAAVQAATDSPSAQAQVHARAIRPAPAAEHKAAAGHQAARAHHTAAKAASAAALNRAHHAAAKAKHHARAKAASKPAPQAASPSNDLSGMTPFEQCVAWRESGDNPTASSAGLFGILPSTWASLGFPGTAGGASISMQKTAFDKLYAMYGTSPWAPYDGC